jgi:hypothetical protein
MPEDDSSNSSAVVPLGTADAFSKGSANTPMKIDFNMSGRWITEDEDSDVELTIGFEAGIPSVCARCRSDGEQLEVVGIRTEGDVLSFETAVPSSGYRARNRMRFLTPDTCEMEITFWEKWKRIE